MAVSLMVQDLVAELHGLSTEQGLRCAKCWAIYLAPFKLSVAQSCIPPVWPFNTANRPFVSPLIISITCSRGKWALKRFSRDGWPSSSAIGPRALSVWYGSPVTDTLQEPLRTDRIVKASSRAVRSCGALPSGWIAGNKRANKNSTRLACSICSTAHPLCRFCRVGCAHVGEMCAFGRHGIALGQQAKLTKKGRNEGTKHVLFKLLIPNRSVFARYWKLIHFLLRCVKRKMLTVSASTRTKDPRRDQGVTKAPTG